MTPEVASLGGLSLAAALCGLWVLAAVAVGESATGRSVSPGWLGVIALSIALAVARTPPVLIGLLLMIALWVPPLSPSPATAGWRRSLVFAGLAGAGTLGAGISGRQLGDETITVAILLGFLALAGMLPFGWHMARWLDDAPPGLAALVAGGLLPAAVAALVAAEPALSAVHSLQRSGVLLAGFGAVTAILAAVWALRSQTWTGLAVRTVPCEVGLALVGVATFDARGLQAAALTLAVLAVTRPILLFADALGPRRGPGLLAMAMAVVAAAGLPPTLGFPARVLMLSSAVRLPPLIAVLTVTGVVLELAAIAAVLRRRLAVPGAPEAATAARGPVRGLAAATAVVLVVGGLLPGALLRYAFHLGG